MKGLNRATLMGNVGRDPEVRYVDENVPVCTFSLATSESYTSKSGERVTQTEWHNIVLWRGLAEIAEKYVKKGDPIYIEGRIRTRSYQDKENPNVTRYTTEVIANDIRLLGRRDGMEAAPVASTATSSVPTQQPQNTPSSTPAANTNNPNVYDEDDDLPF